MRCYICDAELTEVEFDHDLSIRPCGVCLEAIDEALEDFDTNDLEEETTDHA